MLWLGPVAGAQGSKKKAFGAVEKALDAQKRRRIDCLMNVLSSPVIRKLFFNSKAVLSCIMSYAECTRLPTFPLPNLVDSQLAA